MEEAGGAALAEAVPKRTELDWRQSMLGWVAALSMWLSASFGLVAIKPPAFLAMLLPAVVVGIVAAGIVVVAERRAWLSTWLRAWGIAAAVATAIALTPAVHEMAGAGR